MKKSVKSEKELWGIDIDDVIAGLLVKILEWHNDVYGTRLSPKDHRTYRLWETWNCTEEEAIKKVLDFYQGDYFMEIVPVEGSVEGISELCEYKQLVLITSRPSSIDQKTRLWLDRYFPDKFSNVYYADHFFNLRNFGNNFRSNFDRKAAVFGRNASVEKTVEKTIKRTKGDLCRELGITTIVEDCMEYALDCAEKGIITLLFDDNGKLLYNQCLNSPLHRNMIRMPSWDEIVKYGRNGSKGQSILF